MNRTYQIGQGLEYEIPADRMGKYFDKTIRWLEQIADREGGMEKLAARLGVKRATFYTYFAQKPGKKTSIPSGEALLDWMEHLGVKLIFPGEEKKAELTRDVVFEQPKLVNVPPGSPRPDSSRYLAVPLVGVAGAGPWRDDPIEEFTGDYLMVLRNHRAVSGRFDLIGVKVGKGETSMLGTLDPEDICLVDKADIMGDPQPPGNIYLVRDPSHGVAIKRVVFERDNGTENIVFYSDNARENPPIVRDFQKVYGGDRTKALIGRVVVGLADMTKK